MLKCRGAAFKLTPNPLIAAMVPEGTEVIPDPDVHKLRSRRTGQGKTPKTVKDICAQEPRYNTPKRRRYCADWNKKNREKSDTIKADGDT